MRHLAFLLLCFCLLPIGTSATIDYLVVNHYTKQLYWAETDHPPGWIGWEGIPDGIYAEEEERYLALGYRFTNNPFLIEEIGVIGALLIYATFWFMRRRKRRQHANNLAKQWIYAL